MTSIALRRVHRTCVVLTLAIGALGFAMAVAHGQNVVPQLARWYRGNTHTHTLNSDGNAAPDAVARWYREHGYQFVAITDHEFLTDVVPLNGILGAAGQFLVLPGQEITQRLADATHPQRVRQAHINGIGLARLVLPEGPDGLAHGTTMAALYAQNIAAVRAAGGLAQINHPNWRWSVRAQDLLQLPDSVLFEIWNGQPFINNLGGTDDAGHVAPSAEALWDTLLTHGKVVWGVGDDDSHEYDRLDDPATDRPGQAWVMVRAEMLTSAAITTALRQGHFYASTGIFLRDVVTSDTVVALTIDSTGGGRSRRDTRFLTRFIGGGGRVLAEVPGLTPRYRLRGDEGYVRATVADSNGLRAWTQPVLLRK